MNQLRPWLYIGKYIDTLDQQRLNAHSIGAMLQLADLVEQPGITSLYLPVEDFEPLPFDVLRQGVDFVREAKQQGHTVLIACGAGINRSTTYCVATLKEEEGLGLLKAFKEIKQKHGIALPNLPLWQSLCEYYQEDVPFQMVLALSEQ
ncbi:MAG: dual specificity protein phosphatase [Chloroflexota bacterium]